MKKFLLTSMIPALYFDGVDDFVDIGKMNTPIASSSFARNNLYSSRLIQI